MPKQKNISVVTDLKEKVAKAKSIVVTDYRGLTHKQAEDLHRNVKKAGGEYLVVKNSLLKIATQSSPYNLEPSPLSGPTAVLLSYADEITPLKELAKFIKTTTLPKIKFSFMSGVRYDDKQTETLSKLPGKLELQTTLVGRLSSPMYGLLYSLNGNLTKLVYVLSQIKPEVKN